MKQPGQKRIALVYDALYTRGGAEYLTLLMAHHFPNMDVYAASRGVNFGSARLGENIHVLTRRITPSDAFLRGAHTYRIFRANAARLAAYDLVIYSGLYAPFAVLRKQPPKSLLYCHDLPLPFVYGWYDYYMQTLGFAGRSCLRLVAGRLRRRFEEALSRFDVIVANSRFTAGQFEALAQREVKVLYPACDLSRFQYRPSNGYYLSFARLEKHKRVDRAVKAFLDTPDKRLIVASNGAELGRLKRLAAGADNITFTESTDPAQIADLLSECIASIHVGMQEPFGISAVESLASGKPVIAVREGGLTEIAEPGRCGSFIEYSDPRSIRQAVRSLDSSRAAGMKANCQQQAQRFSPEIFLREFEALVTRYL